MGVFSALLALVSPVPLEPELRFLSPAEIEATLRDCGLKHVAVAVDQAYDLDLVELGDTELSDEQLACAFRAADYTQYTLVWEAPVAARYYKISGELTAPRERAKALAYFASRPELGSVPERKSDETDLTFARRLEAFCGDEAEGFFTDEFGGLAMSPDWAGFANLETSTAVLECIRHAAVLADLPFGFVGNDMAPDDGESFNP